MITLNLVNKETSDIKFEVSHFPDGQNDITLNLNGGQLSGHSDIGMSWQLPVNIKARFNNFEDLGLIIAANTALRRLGAKEIYLYIPYLMGARSDREFQNGGNSYLVDVIAPILNLQAFESITVLDVHSNVAPACIKNLKMIDNADLVNFALNEIYPNITKRMYLESNCVLVSPDAGASHKIVKLAEKIGYKGDIITCSKERDNDGKLTSTVVPLNGISKRKDFIIIDDICDGGRTFINIAKKLIEEEIDGKIYLIVTHGIFSAGFKELSEYFDGIYCTNSYSNLKFHPSVNDIIGPSVNLAKQLNIF